MPRVRWTLRRKILLGQGVVLALLVILCAFAFLRVQRLGRASEAILSENYRSIIAAENMIDALERQDSAALLVLLGRSGSGAHQFHDNETRFIGWYARARENITIPDEVEILDRIERDYEEYLAAFGALRVRVENPDGEATAYYDESVLPLFESLRDACSRLRRVNEAAMYEASERAEDLARQGVLSLALIGGIAVALGLLFSLFLATVLTKPIRRLLEATQRIAAGDYDVRVEADRSDELGGLAREFNDMVEQLREYRAMNVERLVAEKLRGEAVLRSIDDGLILLDDALLVRRLNPAAESILGIDAESARGRHLLEIVESETMAERARRASEREKEPPADPDEDTIEVGWRETTRIYQYSVTPVSLESGVGIGVVIVLRDVTKLHELDRLKSEFVMTASHELRTPLTSIEMSLDLLAERRDDPPGPRERELLQAAREDVQRLVRLVENLLDLTRIETGRIDLDIVSFPVFRLFEDLRSVFEIQFREKGVELWIEDPDRSLTARADPEKIAWVLTNLVSNALRYTDSGGRVEVDAHRSGPWVTVSVGDTGEGIPPEQQVRIFDQFVQLDSSRGVGGAGLGLAISREIVRAHGGAIWVDSSPGQGSLFTFILPVVELATMERRA